MKTNHSYLKQHYAESNKQASNHILALHAPAGDLDSVKAAVYNGANAIYLGIKLFNARRLAKNFSLEQLKDIVFFCHLHSVNVYLTMNTLVRNEELLLWFKTLEQAYIAGIDGVIIQEIFFAPYIKNYFPGLRIHASTQASFMNYHGINQFKEFTTVVLARELIQNQIKNIRKQTNVELEMFVHGHVCISYSGQCLISSLIGKRSGNRGVCASSCRKNYNNQGYLISAKDLFLANSIDKIYDLGINAIKIEGRMKSADYVAVTTKMYRKQIDAIYARKFKSLSQEELNQLKLGFNRDFTTGFFGNNTSIVGKEMPMNRGIYLGTVYHGKLKLEHDLARYDGVSFWHPKNNGKLTGCIVRNILIQGAFQTFAKKGMLISLPSEEFVDDTDVFLTSKNNQGYVLADQDYTLFPVKVHGSATRPLSFKVNEMIVVSDIALVHAQNQELKKEHIIAELQKSQRIGIKFEIIDSNLESNLFLPKSTLRKMREALEEKIREKIVQKRISSFTTVPQIVSPPVENFAKFSVDEQPKLIVKVYTLEQVKEAEATGVYALYYDIFNKDLLLVKELCKNTKFFLDTPVILTDDEVVEIQKIVDLVKPDGIVISNWGLLTIDFNGEKHGAYSLNVFNDISVTALQDKGILPMMSVELNAKQVMKFSDKHFIYYTHGRIPVMHFKGVFHEKKLTDEAGYSFPLRIVHNNTEMLYSRPLATFEKISELIQSGIKYFFLDLERDTTTIIKAYQRIIERVPQDISMLKKGTTLGNYNKGVA